MYVKLRWSILNSYSLEHVTKNSPVIRLDVTTVVKLTSSCVCMQACGLLLHFNNLWIKTGHQNEKLALSNSSGLKSVFENLRCLDGLVYMDRVGLTTEMWMGCRFYTGLLYEKKKHYSVFTHLQMKFKYPARTKMRWRTNQMIAFNKPCGPRSQDMCKFKLQIKHW